MSILPHIPNPQGFIIHHTPNPEGFIIQQVTFTKWPRYQLHLCLQLYPQTDRPSSSESDPSAGHQTSMASSLRYPRRYVPWSSPHLLVSRTIEHAPQS